MEHTASFAHLSRSAQQSDAALPAASLDESAQSVTIAAPPLHVAYLVNQYPKVSHTFIRREILALEQQGVRVERFAQRGWDAQVVDPVDVAEKAKTRYTLESGIMPLLLATLRVFVRTPKVFLKTVGQMIAVARRSDKTALYHFAYLAQACQLRLWLATCRATHIHAHFGTNSCEIAMYVRMLGGPNYSFTVHGADEADRGKFLSLAKKVAHAKFVVAISSYTRSQLFRHAEYKDWGKIKIVHCGLEKDFYSSDAPHDMVDKTLLCVGRFSEEKGHVILLDAFARVLEKHNDCHLVLAGDGDLRPQIESKIATLGLSQHVRITGWISSGEVRREIHRSRALVLSSFQEGLPVVIMEAMALKRPVVSTYVAGIPELVQPGVTGWLVPPGNTGQLADALDECLSAPMSTLQDMGRAAHNRVVARHAIEREAFKLSALFSSDQILDVTEEWIP